MVGWSEWFGVGSSVEEPAIAEANGGDQAVFERTVMGGVPWQPRIKE